MTAAEMAAELSELAGNVPYVTLRTTYNLVTPESAEDSDYAEHGWVGADGRQIPMGGDVGPQVLQPGHPWREGRDASAIEFALEDGESMDDFVERMVEEILGHAWGCDHAQREPGGFSVASHPGEMDPHDGSVESRCVHVECGPDLSARILAALGRA